MRDKTAKEIMDVFEINRNTLQVWVRKGCPVTKSKIGGNRFDETEVASWMKANGLTGKAGRPVGPMSEQLMAAKLRKENAMADKHEIEVARIKGLLVEKSQNEADNVKKFTVIRNKLLGLPASVAPTITGMNAPDIERELETRIREVLTELSRA